MRRPIQMQPPGNMAGVFRPKRVSSSTAASRRAIDGTEVSSADAAANEFSSALTGVERHVMAMVESGSLSWSDGYDVLEQCYDYD